MADQLIVAIVQGASEVPPVVRSVRALAALGQSLHIRIVPSSEAEGRALLTAVGAGYEHVSLALEVEPFPDVRDEPGGGALVFCVEPGSAPLPGILEQHQSALLSNPEVIMSLCPVADGQDVSEPVPLREAGLVDGRQAARELLLGLDPFNQDLIPFSFRLSSIDPHDRHALSACMRRAWKHKTDWLTAALPLFVRGSVWWASEPGLSTSPLSPNETGPESAEPEPWQRTIARALELDLLADPGDATRALSRLSRHLADSLRREAHEHGEELGTGQREEIRFIIDQWRQLAQPPRLPLHVAVCLGKVTSGVPPELQDSVRSAEEVSWLTVPTPQSTPSPGFESLSDAEVASIANAHVRPTLFLNDDESLVVRDRGQIERVLTRRDGPATFMVPTPEGSQRRIVWPSSKPSAGASVSQTVRSIEIRSAKSTQRLDWLPQVEHRPAPHRLRKFIIAAPGYTERHAGVVALHRLCDRLNAAGYEAYVEVTGPEDTVRTDWDTPRRRGRSFSDAVVVYPEVISGNPFGARRVVRWLLNRPGWFTGAGLESDPGDLIVTFNQQIAPDTPVLTLPLVDPTIFFPKDTPGSGSLLWIGKGNVPEGLDRTQFTLITSTWPGSRSALASLLRAAEVLYSCDWMTTLVNEALMCATPVVLLGEQNWSRDDTILHPGMTLGGADGLSSARREVAQYFPDYLENSLRVGESIESFVSLVNDHFGDGPTTP